MSEANRLLHNNPEGGDIVGREPAGRVVTQVVVDRRDFELPPAFGADAVEDGRDDVPHENLPMSPPCWLVQRAGLFVSMSEFIRH